MQVHRKYKRLLYVLRDRETPSVHRADLAIRSTHLADRVFLDILPDVDFNALGSHPLGIQSYWLHLDGD